MQLFVRTLRTSGIGLILFAILIFAPAGTLAYWQGWAFIAVFGLSTTVIGIYLALKDPALLARRVRAGPARLWTGTASTRRLVQAHERHRRELLAHPSRRAGARRGRDPRRAAAAERLAHHGCAP